MYPGGAEGAATLPEFLDNFKNAFSVLCRT